MDVSVERAIHFIIANNETIIQWLGLFVILLLLGIVGFSVFSKAPHDPTDPNDVQVVLKKLIDQAQGPLGATAASGAGGEGEAKLRAELEQKKSELEKLKAESKSPGGQSDEILSYQKKIKDLEGRLSEYEILEDDIADLSLYKEENTRLKAELAGKAPGTPQTKTEDVAPKEEEAKEEPVKEEPPSAQPAAVAKPTPGGKEDLVAEFAAAVEQKKPAPAPAPAPAAAKAEVAPSAPAEPEEAPAAVDDLLTEFAQSLEENGGEADQGLDTDKMLAEVEALGDVTDDGTSALDEAADIDKMAAEASKLSAE